MLLNLRQLVVVVIGLVLVAPVRADFDASFQGVSPGQNLTIAAGSTLFDVKPTGLYQFDTGTGAGAEGFGANFSGVCSEIFANLADGAFVSHTVVGVAALNDLVAPPSGNADPTAKAAHIKELWGRHYADALGSAESAAAFQLAVWEIIYDPLTSLDVKSGYLRVEGESLTSPTADLANAWLAQLSGDESLFNNNPLYAGQELVGLSQIDFQDQITTRTPSPVPAPPALVLGVFGVMGLVGWRRLRR